MLASLELYVVVILVGVLVAPWLTGAHVSTRPLRVVPPALALAFAGLTAALVVRHEPFRLINTAAGTEHTVLIALHLAAATVWSGGVLYLAAGASSLGRAGLGRAVRRFSPYAVASALALPVTGYGLLLVHEVHLADLPSTAFGRLVIVKIGLLVVSAALGFAHRRRGQSAGRVRWLGAESALLASALAVAAVLSGLPDPEPAAAVSSDLRDAKARSGFALGRLLATTTGFTGSGLDCAPRSADAGAAYGAVLRRLHAGDVSVLVGGGREARVFARWVEHADAGAHVVDRATGNAALVVGSRRFALRTLAAFSGGASTGAIYLAPWLLDGTVLRRVAAERLPLVSVGAFIDPMSPAADEYRAALARLLPGVAPTVTQLRGYLSVADPQATYSKRLVLYAASPVGFLPGVLDVGHEHGTDGWFAGGTLTPMTTPVPVPMRCRTSAAG